MRETEGTPAASLSTGDASAMTDTQHADPELKNQNRNVLIYAAQEAMIFISSSTLYVGFVQATLCKRLNTSNTIANLPSTVCLSMVWLPVIVAWLLPQVRLLKPTLVAAHCMMAFGCAQVALVLMLHLPTPVIIGSLLVQAAIVGSANGVVNTHTWEIVSRGVPERLRGKTFALAMGGGAVFAVISSLGAQFVLHGALFGWRAPSWLSFSYPANYALLFLLSAFFMAVSAVLVLAYRFPLPKTELVRQPFRVAVIGGVRSVVQYRVLLFVCLGYLLAYAGDMIQVNMSIYAREATGQAAETLVGYQLALRFGAKIIGGVLLGVLLARTNPRVTLLATLGLLVAAVVWTLAVPGYWYLVAFGLNGAGELFGIYFVNYAVSCSPKSKVRRNLALLYLIGTLVGFAPVLYGWISDTWNMQASFWAALGILGVGILLVAPLPRWPRPRPQDMTDADVEQAS